MCTQRSHRSYLRPANFQYVNWELEYRIPRLHYPVNFWRFPEMFGDSCKSKISFQWVLVENRFIAFAPVGFRTKPHYYYYY